MQVNMVKRKPAGQLSIDVAERNVEMNKISKRTVIKRALMLRWNYCRIKITTFGQLHISNNLCNFALNKVTAIAFAKLIAKTCFIHAFTKKKFLGTQFNNLHWLKKKEKTNFLTRT